MKKFGFKNIASKLSFVLVAAVQLLGFASPVIVYSQSANDLRSIFSDTPNYDPDSSGCPDVTTQSTALAPGSSVYMVGSSTTAQALSDTSLINSKEDLASKIAEAGFVVSKINADGGRAISTDTVAPGSSALEAVDEDADIIASSEAVVVAIFNGSSNLNGGKGDLTTEIPILMDKIRSHNSDVKIYMATYFTAGEGAANRNTEIRTLSNPSQQNYTVIDTATAGIDVGPDDIHTTEAGLKVFSAAIANGLKGTVSTATGSSSDYLLSLSYPNFPDESVIAKGIEDTVRARSPHSPWLNTPNLGQFMINEGKKDNVNPLLVVATGGVESSFGTAGKGVPNHNAFGINKGNQVFGSWDAGTVHFTNFIREALDGKHAPNYALATTIYEYSSVHQTGGIYYPGINKVVKGTGPDFPIQDTKESGGMGVEVSWESQYNPLAYYKLNITIINQITGQHFPVDDPGAPSTGGPAACASSNGPLVAGIGGFDLPGEGPNPMVYYSQLKSGTDKAVQGYFGDHPYGNGTIQECGCAAVSMAMVVSTLTVNKVTPLETADYAIANNFQLPDCGTSIYWLNAATQEKYGITVREVKTTDEIAQSVIGGKLVLLHVNSFPLPGHAAGHYTIIRKYVDGKFYFADPFADGWAAVKDVSRRAYTAEEVAGMYTGAWEVSAK